MEVIHILESTFMAIYMVRFINPTPAAEAKLLGEKVARNAKFREDTYIVD